MKLYTYPTAPNPRRVHMAAAEKGIALESVFVDVTKGEQRQDWFREKNAFAKVPTLELDDGTCISESVAICRYLEAVQPEPALFGTTPAEQGLVEMWIRRIEFGFMMPVAQVWVHASPLTAGLGEQIAIIADTARPQVDAFYKRLDRLFATRAFVVGDDFSMADIVAYTIMEFAQKLVRLPAPEGLENLQSWYARIDQRPCAQQA